MVGADGKGAHGGRLRLDTGATTSDDEDSGKKKKKKKAVRSTNPELDMDLMGPVRHARLTGPP